MARKSWKRPAPDRRAAQLEQRLLNGEGAKQDPTLAKGNEKLGFGNGPEFVLGRVVDSIAYCRTYKVQCDRGAGTLRCSDAAHGSLGLLGAKPLHTYSIGTPVVVLIHPQLLYGIIICSFPDWSPDAKWNISDEIVPGSNVGLQVDNVHSAPFTLQSKGGIIDFSAGRPLDSLQHGEWGAITELGMRVFLDTFMAQVGADEETGLFVSYLDQLTRLAGHNLQIRSAGHVREDLDDESEFSRIDEDTPYIHEALGLYAANGTPFTENTVETCQLTSPYLSRYEPVDSDQLGLYRSREFRGYLGQGGKRTIFIPVSGGDDTHRYSTAASKLFGVAEENWGLDGGISTRSAQSIFFMKAPLIPSPKRKKRPEDKTGDTSTNYASCGVFGDGPEHHVKASPTNANTNPSVIEPAVLFDMVAYAYNWKGDHPFHYHELDWSIPDESDISQSSVLAAPPFADLESNNFLPAAGTFQLAVDDRYGLTKYYANISIFAMLPGGGISIVDGWGSEIRMVGGHIYQFSAGDNIVAPGRNAVTIAGWDVSVQANSNIELATNVGTVRVKGERQVLIMGGNNDCGGVLIESKSSGPAFSLANETVGGDIVGGIVLRARNSAITCLSGSAFVVSTRAWGDSSTAHILLDAGAESDVVFRGRQHRRHIAQCGLDLFTDGPINEYWSNGAWLGTQLVVTGNTFLWNDVVVSGDLVATGNVTGSAFGTLTDDQSTAVASLDTTISARDLSATTTDSVTQLTWLTEQSDAALLEFYFPAAAQYLTVSFTINEPVWAQLARLSGNPTAAWSGTIVQTDEHIDSMPYPGMTIWLGGSGYGRNNLSLFDPATMLAADRGSVYENASLANTTLHTLNGNWPVIVNPS